MVTGDNAIVPPLGLLKAQPEQGFLEYLTFQLQLNDYQKSSMLTERVRAKSLCDISKSRLGESQFLSEKGAAVGRAAAELRRSEGEA